MLLPSKAQTKLYTNFSRLWPQLSFSTLQLRLFCLIGNLSKRQRGTPGREQRKKERQFPEALSLSLGLRLMANTQATDPEEIRVRRYLIAWEIWEELEMRATLRPRHRSSAPGGLMGTTCLPLHMCWWTESSSVEGLRPLSTGTTLLSPSHHNTHQALSWWLRDETSCQKWGKAVLLEAGGESAWLFNCAKTTLQNRYISNRDPRQRVLLKLK